MSYLGYYSFGQSDPDSFHVTINENKIRLKIITISNAVAAIVGYDAKGESVSLTNDFRLRYVVFEDNEYLEQLVYPTNGMLCFSYTDDFDLDIYLDGKWTSVFTFQIDREISIILNDKSNQTGGYNDELEN